MTTQLNVRLPEPTIEDINWLADIYGSQAKAIIAAATALRTALRKEIEMKQQAKQLLEDISAATTQDEAYAAADKAIAAMQALPEKEQEEIARQELLRFKNFIGDRIAKANQ